MQRVKMYTTVFARTLKELNSNVNLKIAAGFQPYGNPYTYCVPDSMETTERFLVCQAMVEFEVETLGMYKS
jgi:hypothetical protein